MGDFITEYVAGGKIDEISPAPLFEKPYIKGKKLEAYGEGIFGGSVVLDEDAELVGIGFSATEMNFTDYIEVEVEGKKIIEQVAMLDEHSSVFSIMNMRVAYFLKSKTPIKFKYISGNPESKHNVAFMNFHFLVGKDDSVQDDGDNGFDKYPDEGTTGEKYNLIGTDEDGGKSVDWNHKRFNSGTNFETIVIDGKKKLVSKTPMTTGKDPIIKKAIKVLEVVPYNEQTHPERKTVINYITSKYGFLQNKYILDVESIKYGELLNKDLMKYDAVIFSPADCNCSKSIPDGAYEKIQEFADTGRVLVICHDFLNYGNNLKLAPLFSVLMNNDEPMYSSPAQATVSCVGRGQITDFPYYLPDKFNVMGYHRTTTTVKLGDNWFVDDVGLQGGFDYTKNYVWLTSNDNCIMMEAGHSYYRCDGNFNNNPIEWECKALINTLFMKTKPEYEEKEGEAIYIVNLPENKYGGYIQLNMACYTKKDGKLKPGACRVEIYNDNKLLEEVKFPQNDLDPNKYNEEGWSTIEYNGKLTFFPNTKTIKIRYVHTSSNENALIELKTCDAYMYGKEGKLCQRISR